MNAARTAPLPLLRAGWDGRAATGVSARFYGSRGAAAFEQDREATMVSMLQLWAPILLSAVGVFVASSLIHMVLKWHNADYLRLSNEDEVRVAIRSGNPKPGQYVIPYCIGGKDMKDPELMKKFTEGPVGFLTLRRSGPPTMGAALGGWFAFTVVVAIFAACIAARTLPAGTQFAQVFCLVGTVCFLTYAGGAAPNAIWMGKPWGSAIKDMVDGAIYGLVCGAAFGWLWPA
jgi:hypothetical protein